MGLEPTSPLYESGVLAAGRPVLFGLRGEGQEARGVNLLPLSPHLLPRLGSEGLEPSPVRVRAGCAAANTSIPLCRSPLPRAESEHESPGDRTRTDNLVVPNHAGSQITLHPNAATSFTEAVGNFTSHDRLRDEEVWEIRATLAACPPVESRPKTPADKPPVPP